MLGMTSSGGVGLSCVDLLMYAWALRKGSTHKVD